MLRLVTGPFHPTLESALVDDLRSLKARDPLAGVALVVPSDQLRRSLKRLLALSHGLSLLNVHILSFHQLALHLDRERLHGEQSSDRAHHVDLVTDVFFEHLLQQLGQRNVPQTEALRLSQLPRGAWAALWASLRDLKDATVDPAVALRAVDEKQFATEDREKLKGLFTLHAALRESRAALGVGSPDDLAAVVTEFVPASPFLHGLTRLCYYGSYDLTQTQLTLLETLAATVAVTVYFPLATQAAYGFARQFVERHLYPLAVGSENTLPPSHDDTVSPPAHTSNVSVEVRSTAGIDDELTLVCKQILSLVETNGYRFDEIGVVGRTLVPFQTALRRTFDQHRIPFISSATLPLLQEPAVKTLLHLAQLKGSGLYRPAMLEVMTSPWNRGARNNTECIEPRPDLWRVAVQALGITRGEEEWRRLAHLSCLDTSGSGSEERFTEDIGGISIEGGQLRLLWSAVSQLMNDVTDLPGKGGYGELTDAFLVLAERHLTMALEATRSVDPMSPWDDAGDVREALSNVFTQLRELDRLAVDITWDEWTETFMQLLERTTYAVAPASHDGVQVLDAMAARGLGFRALFIVGLNEKVFPRFIHEDGFLRDRHRLILSETLGYKIDQKLQGYAEEALLFELLRSAASERLYLSYQRADTAGRPLAPSTYLDTIGALARQPDTESVFALPRRWPDRAGLALFAPPLLTREELTVSTVLQGRDVSELLEVVGRDGHLFSHGLAAQGAIESDQPSLNAFDGMLEHPTAHWALVSRRGFSPTALESYARCPFQYFADQVLELESVRQSPSMELSPPAMGQLCHEALRHCY
ncbi:MAG: PD-(D/E)XK nuclease family protein, partial [Nitrospira sp.]